MIGTLARPVGGIKDGLDPQVQIQRLKQALDALTGDLNQFGWTGHNPLGFGAKGDGITDDSAALQRTFDAAGVNGTVFLPNRMFAIGTGLTLTAAKHNHIAIIGTHGLDVKGTSGACGFIALGALSYILKVGPDTGTEMSQVLLEGFVLDGAGFAMSVGLLHAAKMSQSKINKMAFRRALGPGMFANKMEDVQITNSELVFLGSAAKPGGLVFGSKPADDTFGSNIVQITNTRFEFIDGGHIRTESGNTTAEVAGLRLTECKLEAGSLSGWGALAANYSILHMCDPTSGTRVVNLSVLNCWIEGAHKADSVLWLGACHTVKFRNNILSCADAAVKLLRIKSSAGAAVRADSVEYMDNSIRNFDLTTVSLAMTIDNLNTVSMRFAYPMDRSSPETMLGLANPTGVMWASEAAEPQVLVTDPDPVTDPCYALSESVAAVTGAGGGFMVRLGSIGATARPTGLSRRMPAVAKVWIRCKKAGTGTTANLRIVSGATTLVSAIAIANTTWAWKEAWMDLSALAATASIAIASHTGNDVGHTVYVDTVKVELVSNIWDSGTTADLLLKRNGTTMLTLGALTASFFPDLTTEASDGPVSVNSGSNSGANDKDAYFQWRRAQTDLWRMGVFGSIGATGELRIRDVVNNRTIVDFDILGVHALATQTTANVNGVVSVNSGTNAGANTNDAYVLWERGQTDLWRAGVLGTVTADGAWRLRDVVNSLTLMAALTGNVAFHCASISKEPTGDVSIPANHSVVIADHHTIAAGKTLTIGAGATLQIL